MGNPLPLERLDADGLPVCEPAHERLTRRSVEHVQHDVPSLDVRLAQDLRAVGVDLRELVDLVLGAPPIGPMRRPKSSQADLHGPNLATFAVAADEDEAQLHGHRRREVRHNDDLLALGPAS